MGIELKIEHMSEQDIEEIIDIGTGTPEFNTGTSAQQFYGAQTLKRWIADPNGVTLIARAHDKLVGFLLGYYMAGPNDGYLNCISVSKKYRKRGVGKELLQKALSEFKVKG